MTDLQDAENSWRDAWLRYFDIVEDAPDDVSPS